MIAFQKYTKSTKNLTEDKRNSDQDNAQEKEVTELPPVILSPSLAIPLFAFRTNEILNEQTTVAGMSWSELKELAFEQNYQEK